MPLIRARSVVQVHPGPPSKSPVNTRLFSLFPFRGISLKKPICQLFANSRMAEYYIQGVTRQRNSRNHAERARSSEITRPEEQKPTEALRAEDRGEPIMGRFGGQGQAPKTISSRQVSDWGYPKAMALRGDACSTSGMTGGGIEADVREFH